MTAVHTDGSLRVATVEGHEADGAEVLGPPMTLPASYVAADVSLAYAGTVHATQGLTVDTGHLVATPATGRAAAYVGLTRGRDANTAHVTTVFGPADVADGLADDHSLHRDPLAVLAGTFDDVTARNDGTSALAAAVASADDAATTRTAGELFTDAAALAAVARTGRWLDDLAADGTISGDDRARLAAEDGAASLARVLRRAELAGYDPEEVLRDAVADRPLDGARNLTNVVHARIRDGHTFDPTGSTWTEWTPRTGHDAWDRYLSALADAADQRAQRLATELAADPPRWLTDAIGPVPEALDDREGWLDNAATVAAWRELQGYDRDDDALGPAPAPGQVEAYASYRAAWRALGRPEIDREELELSDGQLRVRVRAHEREAAWAPRYVANELAGTHQAAARARQNGELRRAEAAASTQGDRERLAEAGEADALAKTLDERARELALVDEARARWLAHTAGTRAAAERAKAELAARHADDADVEPAVTAEEWLAAHREAVVEDEVDRVVTEIDIDERPELAADVEAFGSEPRMADDESVDDESPVAVESEPDVRQVAAAEPAQSAEDDVRVPSADESADAVSRAQRALAEIQARDEADQREEAAHRADQLAQWHDVDQVDEASVAADAVEFDDVEV